MKQIKLRAWDAGSKTMYYIGDASDYKWVVEIGDDTWGQWALFEVGKSEPAIVVGSAAATYSALMQYIGQEDCKGNPIYEGDILMVDDSNWGYSGGTKATSGYDYVHDGYLYIQVPEMSEMLKWDGIPAASDFVDIWLPYSDKEVVGNIYETDKYVKDFGDYRWIRKEGWQNEISNTL